MKRREVLAATAAVATPLVAGCGGDGSGGGGGGTTTTTETETIGSEDTVELRDNSFDPLTVKIDVGEAVRWVNREDVEHTITSATFSESAVSWEFDETLSSSGEAVTRTFETEGIHEYRCTIHGKETMCGAVLVGAIFNTPGAYDAGSQLPCSSESEG
ncbi:MAG: plastocyanin/azurin family copper-binding protein [Halobacteriaceae archaeon]